MSSFSNKICFLLIFPYILCNLTAFEKDRYLACGEFVQLIRTYDKDEIRQTLTQEKYLFQGVNSLISVDMMINCLHNINDTLVQMMYVNMERVMNDTGIDDSEIEFIKVNYSDYANITEFKFDEEKMKSTWNFINKLWNASRYVLMNIESLKEYDFTNINESDKWILSKYEKIVKVLYDYRSNIELALQALMMYNDVNINELDFVKNSKDKKEKNLAIIFGSNQGLCGRFNDKIMNFVVDDIKSSDKTKIIIVGERLNMLMSNTKLNIEKSIPVPNSIDNISSTIFDILEVIEKEIKNKTSDKVFLYYIANDDTMNGTLTKTRLIPVDKKILENAQKKVWPTNNIQYWQINSKTLIVDLLKQYIFVGLNNALINSIASEQKNRLITLQNAENNINDLIRTKNLEYNQKRQGTITSELLDVVTGYAVAKKRK